MEVFENSHKYTDLILKIYGDKIVNNPTEAASLYYDFARASRIFGNHLHAKEWMEKVLMKFEFLANWVKRKGNTPWFSENWTMRMNHLVIIKNS